MAPPDEKDVETMPTQKTFKQRIRQRAAKTGESYTAARHQLLRRASDPPTPAGDTGVEPPTEFTTSDTAMRRGSGRARGEWFALLDAWGAAGHSHTEIAIWLRESHGVGSWWAQSITVDYERARGMRARHQTRGGFSISASRTVAASPEQLLEAVTSETVRLRWLPDAPLSQRPTRAANTARFDWSDPPSRVVVTVAPKGADRATIFVQHERLPDEESADRLKQAWREWLAALKSVLQPE